MITVWSDVKNRWPNIGGLYFAIFNCREHHVDKGRVAVLAKYGVADWKLILKCKRSGIMEIFDHPPSHALILFAETVADASEAAYVKRHSSTGDNCEGGKHGT